MQPFEQLLHQKAEVEEYDADKLPIYLKHAYDISILHVAGVDCLLAKPKQTANLVTLRKQQLKMKQLTGLECVLRFDKTSPYIKQKLIEEGLPFIIENKDVYLPFLGIALSDRKERILPKAHKISFNTQKLLLTALYDRWNTVNVTETAKKLKVSKMAVSRYFDQVQAVGLPLICETGKERRFVWEGSAKDLWDLILPHLRNPVIREYRLDEPLADHHYPLGGMSALSKYGMLNDNDYPTYALTKIQGNKLDIERLRQIPENEQPTVLLQVMQYVIRFPDNRAIDPVAAYLSLDATEKEEPRIKMALENILGEYVYDSRS